MFGYRAGQINRGRENSRFVALVMAPYFEWHLALYNDPDNPQHRLVPILADNIPTSPSCCGTSQHRRPA